MRKRRSRISFQSKLIYGFSFLREKLGIKYNTLEDLDLTMSSLYCRRKRSNFINLALLNQKRVLK